MLVSFESTYQKHRVHHVSDLNIVRLVSVTLEEPAVC